MSDESADTEETSRKQGVEDPDHRPGHESEQFVDFFENSPVPMHWVGPDGTVLRANQAELDALGYSREEYVGSHIADFHADQDLIDDILDRLRSGEEVNDYEARMERKDGSIRHVLIDSCVNWEDGEFVNTRCVTHDITERKERERELEEVYSRISDGFYALDEDWEFTYLNEQAHDVINPDGRELEGKHIWDEFPAATERKFKPKYERAVSEQETVSFEEYYPDPLDAWFQVRAYPSETGLSVYFQDITERKQQERELEQEKRRYETLFENSNDAIFLLDVENDTIKDANSQAAELLEYPHEELVSSVALSDVHSEHIEEFRAFIDSVKETGHGWTDDYQCRKGTSGKVDAEMSMATVELDGTTYVHASVRDVTERKERERQLRESEERFRTLADSFPNGGVFYFDDDLRYQYASGSGFDPIDTSPEDLMGNTLYEVDPYTEEVIELLEPLMRETLEGNRDTIELPYEDHVYEVHSMPLRDEAGTVTGGFYITQDITERKERQQELAEERAFTEQTLDALNDVFYVIDSDGTLTRWNEHVTDITGYSDAELTDMDMLEFFPEDERPRVTESMGETIETGSSTVEADVLTADGQRVPYEFSGQRLTDAHGEFLGIVGVGRDLSERKEREAELTFVRDLLEKTEHVADVGGWEIDTKTSEVFWTDHLYDMLGVDYEEDPTLEEALNVYIEEDRPRVANAVEEAIAAGESFDVEARFQRPSGEIRWFQIQGEPVTEDGEVTTLRGAVQDVTRYKDRERQLRESEQRYRTLAESFPNGIVTLFDKDLRYTLASGRAFDSLPVAAADVEGSTPRDVWGDAVGAELESAFEAVLDGLERSVEVEYSDRDWVIHAVPITDESGNVLSGMTIAQDITERKHREEEIADREQALRSAYEIITDSELSVSEQIDGLLEIGRDHLGTDYATFSHIHDDQYEFERVAVSPEIDLEDGDATNRIELPVCERVYQTGDSLVLSDVAAEAPELVDLEWGVACYLGAPVEVNGAPYGTFCFYDIEPRSEAFSDWEQTFVELLGDWVGSELTQQQTTDQLQRQNEQLEEFASVVSHDLRNPLNVAAGRLELAQRESDSGHLEAIEKAHTRMEALIEDLLTLAREGHEVTEYTSVDLGTLVDNCWATVETGEATLVNDIDSTVQADRSRLKQLFENLNRNAVEHGGDDVTVTVGAFENGFYIADDGPGIPQSKRDDVFKPGFSTNTDGTGFGLSIVKQVVDAHGWEICLTEAPAGGARFEISGVEFAAD